MKSHQVLRDIAAGLREHIRRTVDSRGDVAAEEQAIHQYLARFDLAPAEHFAVLDLYRHDATTR